MESALTTSPPSRCASATASAVLPVAVGPTTATTGGAGSPGPPGGDEVADAEGGVVGQQPGRRPAGRPAPARRPRHTGTPAASSRSPSAGSTAASAAASPAARARATAASKGSAAGSRYPGAFTLRRAEPSPMASTPTGPGSLGQCRRQVARDRAPSRGPRGRPGRAATPRAGAAGARGARPGAPGRRRAAAGRSRSRAGRRRRRGRTGPPRRRPRPPRTTSGWSARTVCTAAATAARSRDSAGVGAPATAGCRSGGWGQKRHRRTGRGRLLTWGSVADGAWETAGVSSTENTGDRTPQAAAPPTRERRRG